MSTDCCVAVCDPPHLQGGDFGREGICIEKVCIRNTATLFSIFKILTYSSEILTKYVHLFTKILIFTALRIEILA